MRPILGPKEVVIPMGFDDNFEDIPVQTKRPSDEELSRPLTPEVIVLPKEPATLSEPTKEPSQSPKSPEPQPKSRRVEESPASPSKPSEKGSSGSGPKSLPSKTPSMLTDSQYSTDSLQAYSEPELGEPDESEPEFGAEPRQALLAAIDSLLKDDAPGSSKKSPSKEKSEAKPAEVSEDKPSEGDPSEEVEISPEKLQEPDQKLELKHPRLAQIQEMDSLDRSSGSSSDIPEVSDSQASMDESMGQSSTDFIKDDEKQDPERKSPEDATNLADSGVTSSQQDTLTPSTSTMPSESTPLAETNVKPHVLEDSSLGASTLDDPKEEAAPKDVSKTREALPQQPASEPEASHPPPVEQQSPNLSREPSSAPTDPNQRRSKSLSSSLYPPSDPKPQSDSEPEFIPDPGPSSPYFKRKKPSTTPDLPTPMAQSQTEAYPIEKVRIDPPEAILKIDDSDTNTSSSSSGTNAPRLVFGSQPSSSIEDDGSGKKGKKSEEKQTIV